MDDIGTWTARGLWSLYEPVHAVSYFAPQAAEALEHVGLQGFWRGYFAGRAAPLGAVGPAPVIAMFSSFAPAMVQRALPSVWDLADPDAVLRARAAGAAAAIGSCVDVAELGRAVDAVEHAVSRLPVPGRALAAANAALPTDGDSCQRLWQGVTTLREWRGDAHIAALVSHGLAGLPILVLRCLRDLDRPSMQRTRGWTDAQWSLAADQLRERGLLSGDTVTVAGRDLIAAVEQATDETSTLGSPAEMRDLGRLLHPIAVACASLLSFPNPIGLVAAWDPELDPDARRVTRP